MAKKLEKYFIALVPEGKLQEKATEIKLDLREKFNIKYALKSPAHITVKMPFLWNEHKEEKLIRELSSFASSRDSFELRLRGFWKFGNRVIFIDVVPNPLLQSLQLELAAYSKTRLNLVQELSDRNYTPHMTLAFKDIKAQNFDIYWKYVKRLSFDERFPVDNLALLKKVSGKWEVLAKVSLGKDQDLEDLSSKNN